MNQHDLKPDSLIYAHPYGRYYHLDRECTRLPFGENRHLDSYCRVSVEFARRRGATPCPYCFQLHKASLEKMQAEIKESLPPTRPPEDSHEG